MTTLFHRLGATNAIAVVVNIAVASAWAQQSPGETAAGGLNVARPAATAGSPTPPCAVSGFNCVYAYSLSHRVVPRARRAFQLLRASDGAVKDVGFTRSGAVDTTIEPAFCPRGGCTYHVVYNQTRNNCDLLPKTAGLEFPYHLSSHGLPDIEKSTVEITGHPQTALTQTDCSKVQGTGPKSIVYVGKNQYFSVCCGDVGLGETKFKVDPGGMFAWFFQHYDRPYGLCGLDIEGNSNTAPCALKPVQDVIGLGTFPGVSSGNTIRIFYNDANISTAPPTKPINTQTRVNVGISGDGWFAGPVYFDTLLVSASDLSSIHSRVYDAIVTAFGYSPPSGGTTGDRSVRISPN